MVILILSSVKDYSALCSEVKGEKKDGKVFKVYNPESR